MQKSLLLTALVAVQFACSFLSGCIVAAAGATGVVASEVLFEDNTYIGHIDVDSGLAWAETKTTLGKRSAQPISVDEARRTVVADIEGTTVTASVETYDLNVSVLRVSGKRYGFPDNEVAKMMFDRVIEAIHRGR